MDAPDDGLYSRAPELEDLVGLCRALNREGAKYVLIGGFAVILHGYVRATKDIDLLVEPSPENLRALKRALSALPDQAALLLSDHELEMYPTVRVADEFVIDLMRAACGIDFAGALEGGVEEHAVLGVPIPLASKQLLIRTKDTIRPSDAADVAYLRMRIEEGQERGNG